MKTGTFAIAAGALALGLAMWNTPGFAQGPMFDRVNVNLPYTVTIGDKTLQPGDYIIQQLRDQGGSSRVLLIYSDSGMKFETSAMTIPALDQNTPNDTKIMLHHFGPDYYFDKIWIQGKNYGYEFPLPDSVKARDRERMQPISVAANYQTVPSTSTETTASVTDSQTTLTGATDSQSTTSTAANTEAITPPTTTSDQTSAAAGTNNASTTQDTSATSNSTMERSTATTSGAMQQDTMQPSTTGSADRSAGQSTATDTMPTSSSSTSDTPRTMPATSAGWLMMLLGGGALSGAGLVLRRKR